MKSLTPWLLVVLLGGLAYWSNCRDAKLHDDGVKLDTMLVEHKKTMATVRTSSDAKLAVTDSVMPVDSVRRILRDERATCDTVVSTCEQRVANLKKQLRGSTLSAFAELNYQFPPNLPLLDGVLSARAGVRLRLDRATAVQVFRDQPLKNLGPRRDLPATWNIGVRRELKIF